MSWGEIPTRHTTPESLKIGDMILYKGQPAEVVKIGTWHDTFHGMVYGVDLLVKDKRERTSFVASGRVELVA